jgi:hypothetical protein
MVGQLRSVGLGTGGTAARCRAVWRQPQRLSGSHSAPIYVIDGSGDRQKEEGSRGKAKQEVR